MPSAAIRKKAVQAIERRGCLLVYPLNNKKEPASIWSELYPRSKMRWEWDADGDNRVADLWYLREILSRSRQVVYVKWFQGRATFFSFEVFKNLLAFLGASSVAGDDEGASGRLSPDSRNILELLLADSPLSTKQLKAAAELEGRLNEPTYNRAMKPLWNHLLLVGFGEFQDSSFPSLGIGSAATLFESLWQESQSISCEGAEAFLKKKLGETNPFWKYAIKIKKASGSRSS
ncbi:MAG: hypothetical protein KF799_10480 [Bdellovibrionales bacterium]|nr:hypothetical protein [Bdellovibrionales bacterium]